jgi:hypothetical protein
VKGLKLVHFLFVRWLGIDPDYRAGWVHLRLHRVGFLSRNEGTRFSFINPAEVIRGVHLLPDFASGRTNKNLGPSLARTPSEKNSDWAYFFVNMWVF